MSLMKTLDLTLLTPEENLSLDEALLAQSETGGPEEILRFWEPRRHFVVLGYGNRFESETRPDFCRKKSVPILRRISGGGAVLQGPGCLNFSLILPTEPSGPCRTIAATNRFVMERHRETLEALLHRPVSIQGDTDLALDGRKFSGNSQRRSKRRLLFHGTFLLQMDLRLLEKLLPSPTRQPAYRRKRSHTRFLINLELPAQRIKEALRTAWGATLPLEPVPMESVWKLVERRYSKDDWNFRC